MFDNLRFERNEIMGYEGVSFDLSETLMDTFWRLFAVERKTIERVGELEGLRFWYGEEGCWMGLESFSGGNINLSMEKQRICIDLYPETDPLDCMETIGFDDNWIRYALIMRWIRTLITGV